MENGDDKIHTVLEDMWVFSLYTNRWHKIYVNSDTNPSKRESAIFLTARIDRLAILFGGFYSDQIFNDMWQYNLYTNMWQEFDPTVNNEHAISSKPPGLKFASGIGSSDRFLLYGGATWQ